MSVLLASLTASQGTLVKALFVVAATAIAAALLAYALRGLKLSVSPSRHAVFAVMLPVIALALVYALTANGPAVRQFLATAAVSFGNLTPMISPAQYATAPNPWPAPPADTPQRPDNRENRLRPSPSGKARDDLPDGYVHRARHS